MTGLPKPWAVFVMVYVPVGARKAMVLPLGDQVGSV